MEQRLYAIYDIKSEALVSKVVQILNTDAEASRMFEGVIATPGTLIHDHPQDFNLICLGTIDADTLQLTPNLTSLHVPISTGANIVREIQRARNNAPLNGRDDVGLNQLELQPR